MKATVIATAAVALFAVMAPLPGHATDADTGAALVEEKCARCHATGVSDQSSVSTAPPFRDVAKRYPPEHLAEALAEGITTGHRAMPEFAFSPEQIEGIIAYLSTFNSPAD
jgi:cytochrome c